MFKISFSEKLKQMNEMFQKQSKGGGKDIDLLYQFLVQIQEIY